MRGLTRPALWAYVRAGTATGAGLLLLLYLALPYITLYRFDQALRHGDSAWVDQHVDWPRLRLGIADPATPAPPPIPPDSARTLARLGGQLSDGVFHAAPTTSPAPALPPGARLGWAYFNGPVSFIAHLTMSSRTGPRDVKLVFHFDGTGWRVVRLVAPAELLRRPGPPRHT